MKLEQLWEELLSFTRTHKQILRKSTRSFSVPLPLPPGLLQALGCHSQRELARLVQQSGGSISFHQDKVAIDCRRKGRQAANRVRLQEDFLKQLKEIHSALLSRERQFQGELDSLWFNKGSSCARLVSGAKRLRAGLEEAQQLLRRGAKCEEESEQSGAKQDYKN